MGKYIKIANDGGDVGIPDKFTVISGELTLLVKCDEGIYVSYCPELDLTSYGDTLETASTHLEEVINLFLEDLVERGNLREVLEDCGYRLVNKPIRHWVPPSCTIKKLHLSNTIPH